jgi:hypothetical protein
MKTEHNFRERNHWCCSPWRWTGWAILGIIGFAAFMVLAGVVIMWLWNWIMPNLFKLPDITFWQAIGIAVLARLIFGHPHRGWHHRRIGHWGHRRNHCCEHSGQSEHSGNSCDCNTSKWHYYDQYWTEEGEKSFQEFVKRKTENTDSSK